MGHPARRALSPEETKRVVEAIASPRDKALFILGIATGYRISELLSLRIKDVYEFEEVKEEICVLKSNMKQNTSSRSIWLHPEARIALGAWLSVLGTSNPYQYVFASQRGRNQHLSRYQAWRVLKEAFAKAKVGGHTGTHTLRKTYAQSVYTMANEDLIVTQKALRHANVQSTISYLANVDEKLKGIVIGRKLY